MKRKITIPFLVVLLIALDQAVKYYIVSNFSLGQVRKFIPKIVSLTYLRNTCAVLGAAGWYLLKNIQGSKWLLTGLILIIAGGLGNFIDRIQQGFVVDMFQLDFVNFAIFNVADIYLTVGVAILLLVILKEEKDGI